MQTTCLGSFARMLDRPVVNAEREIKEALRMLMSCNERMFYKQFILRQKGHTQSKQKKEVKAIILQAYLCFINVDFLLLKITHVVDFTLHKQTNG